MTGAVLDAARAALELGLCPHPAATDGTKRPKGRWKHRQSTRPTIEELERDFAGADGIGLVCGQVSAGLEMFELEGRAVAEGLDEQLTDAMEAAGLGPLWDRIITGYLERTPSDGLHTLWTCTEVDGNLKLARRPATADELLEDPADKVKVLIETRGEGGYTVIAPSNGTTHPTGRPWELIAGGLDTIAVITPAERQQLLAVARSFDRTPEPERPAPTAAPAPPRPSAEPDSDRPGDEFNAAHTCADVLEVAGWQIHREDQQGVHWTRPGKDPRHGSSATVYADASTCTLFSSSIDAPPEYTDGHHRLDPWRLHVALNHAGDFSAAARTWRAEHPRPDIFERIGARASSPRASAPDASSDTDDQADGHGALQAALIPVLPARFWAERPALTHIRQAAHSRIRSADLVLHALLARLSAYTPHTYELPPLAGSAGSLNYFAAAIGPSGSGKSSGSAIAGELLTRPVLLDVADDQTLGSGEGLAEHYMGTVEEENDKGKVVSVRQQVRHNAYVYGDEGAALTAMMDRKGATLPEAIRRAWTGHALGQANANKDRSRVIPTGQYRLGMLIGFQPELAGQLLADATAGTPQRFLWASALDPTIPDDLPDWPGPLQIPTITAPDRDAHKTSTRGYTRHHLTLEPDIADHIRHEAKARARGTHTSDELDSHQPLHLLKTAGLLAILDGRLDITADDWRLANMIWATSCRVRASVVAAVKADQERTEAHRIELHVRRESAAEAARRTAPSKVEQLANRIARWIHTQRDAGAQPEDGFPRRDLHHRLKGDERDLLDAVITHATDTGLITIDDHGRYRAGDLRPA